MSEDYNGASAVSALFGRRTIYASTDEISAENIVSVLNEALVYHVQNLLEEETLYWYRRGITPILNRTKERNDFINNKICENHADEIVAFKNGYFLTQPAFYVARNEKASKKVERLNEYLYRSGKQTVDNEVIDWFHTVGKAALIVKPGEDDETPVVVYCLDPRSAFVVYSMSPGNKPVMGVNMVVAGDCLKFDVFTKDSVFRLSGTKTGTLIGSEKTFVATAISVDSAEPNALGHIPIIEYQYNSVNMSAFESVIPLLDAINNVQSNRVDGIEQFIQSIAIAVNCEFEDGTTASQIKKAGMIALKSIGDNKADFKILSEEMDQSQTQVLVDYLYQQVLTICAMPATTKGGCSTSDTGAAVLARDGWYQADAAARNTEDLFKKSNRLFDRIFLDILTRSGLTNLSLNDFELQFVRNETANVQSKAQAFQTLMAAGLHPELAAAKSGISNDPVSDIAMSEKYIKLIWGDPDNPKEKGEAVIVEEDNNNGENDTGGAV